MIALELTSDADLEAFRSVCTATKDSVDSDGGTFWRRRFLTVFDHPRHLPSTEPNSRTRKITSLNAWFMTKYKTMRQVLRSGCDFKTAGHTKEEKLCLVFLRDLAVGKFIPIPFWFTGPFDKL